MARLQARANRGHGTTDSEPEPGHWPRGTPSQKNLNAFLYRDILE